MNKSLNSSHSRLFVYLVCVYIIVWYMQIGNRWELLGAIRFEFLLGAFLSATGILALIRDPRPSSPLKAPVLVFFLVVFFYTFITYDFDASWKTFYENFVKFSMLAVFLSAFVRNSWALKMTIGAFLLAMLKITSEGFIGLVNGGLVWESQGVPRLHGSTLMYRHPNSFSGLAVGCIPFIYYLFPIANKLQKAALAALLIFSAVVIIFTGSRTGYVATGLLIFYFWWEKPGSGKVKYILLGTIGILVSLPLIPQEYIGRFISIFTLEEAEGSSAEARITIIKDALQVFVNYPWGVGVGAFPEVRMSMFGRFQDTHNLYLELLTNMSIFGLFAFFFLIYRILKTNAALQRKLLPLVSEGDSQCEFLHQLSKAIVGFVLARLFLGLFGMDTYEIYWWFAVGFTIALYRTVESIRTEDALSENSKLETDAPVRVKDKSQLGFFPNGADGYSRRR